MPSATAARPFGFVTTEHPFRDDVERFWAAAGDALEHVPAAGVRSVLRLSPDARRLKWVCVSVQRHRDGGFSARTLHYRTGKRRLTTFALRDDPRLPSLARLAGGAGDVLQYIPRQRFAFRLRAAPAIGKAVREFDLEAGWLRLNAVWDAVQRSDVDFAVAEPLRIDRARNAFYQSQLPGRDLAGVIDGANVQALLRRAGRVYAEVQALDVRGVGSWDVGQELAALAEHATLVRLFRPDAAGLVEKVVSTLLATVPAPGPLRFCHGDLRCRHFLVDGDAWSLVDFDGCRLGDPCQDVARLLAFLKRDVPYLRDRFAAPDGGHAELDAAAEAFLAGHAEGAGAQLEPARLTWHLLWHELYFLARMFKRDLYDPLAFERGTERLVALREQLLERLAWRRQP